jgi:hypothetical protein
MSVSRCSEFGSGRLTAYPEAIPRNRGFIRVGDNLLRSSEYVTDTRYRPATALDKLTIGVDSVSTAGLEAQIEAARGGEQVQKGEFPSFLDPFRGDMPEDVSF